LANYTGRISFEKLLASIVPEELVELTNVRREEREVAELEKNPLLQEAAQKKAEDMAQKGYFAHTSPEGVSPWHWFKEVGYEYRYAGENLAVNFTKATEVDRAWMESPTHKENIINERFEEIGIATAEGEYEGREAIFVVQLFGTRKDTPTTALSVQREETPPPSEEESGEEVLGEGEYEKEEKEEDEKEDKESFAFMERVEDDETTLAIGSPESTLVPLRTTPGYTSFWERVLRDPGVFFGYVLLVFSAGLIFSFLLRKLFWKELKPSYVAVNEVLFLLVVLSGILTSHHVLQIFA